jgi:hypothetical protein
MTISGSPSPLPPRGERDLSFRFEVMSRFGAELDFFNRPVDGGEPESWDWDEEVLVCGGEGGYPRKPVPPEEPVVLGVPLG